MGFLTLVQNSSTSLDIQENNFDYLKFKIFIEIVTEVATTGILSDKDIVSTTSKPSEKEEDEITDYLIINKLYKSIKNIVNFPLLNKIDLNQNFNSLKLTVQNMLLNDKSQQLKIIDF